MLIRKLTLGTIEFPLLSLPITILWFVAIINAINLVDGLDGLAAGIAFFASSILSVTSALQNNLPAALMFATFSGALLGFLRYNFNPASIFLGDSGSLFIGFVLAALGIWGSQKSSVAVSILIPMIALGLPLMEAIWAALRRFVFGRKIFEADRDHFHHRLLKLGISQHRAVLLLYVITILMGISALCLVYARDSRASLILLLVGVGMIFGIRKLGYLEYLAADKFIGWFKDLSDDIGLKHDRRSFLSLQVALSGSRDLEEIWNRTLDAAQFLEMEYVELKLFERETDSSKDRRPEWKFRSGRLNSDMLNSGRVMHLILPLASKEHQFGSLALAKDLFVSSLTPFTLRRVEQLRRTLVDTLQNRADEAARESVEKLTRFMESSPDGFFLLDSQLNFIDINESGLKHLGVTKEEIIAKNLQDVFPDIKETGRYDRYLEVIKTAKPFFTHDIIPDSKSGEICLPVKAFKVADVLGIVILLPLF